MTLPSEGRRMTPAFTFLPLPGGTTLITWEAPLGEGHAVIDDAEHARNLAAADLPGFTAEAAQAYLHKFHDEEAA